MIYSKAFALGEGKRLFVPFAKRKLYSILSYFSDNPFFSGIDAMPDIRPRKKSIPLVSELVLKVSFIGFVLNNLLTVFLLSSDYGSQ